MTVIMKGGTASLPPWGRVGSPTPCVFAFQNKEHVLLIHLSLLKDRLSVYNIQILVGTSINFAVLNDFRHLVKERKFSKSRIQWWYVKSLSNEILRSQIVSIRCKYSTQIQIIYLICQHVIGWKCNWGIRRLKDGQQKNSGRFGLGAGEQWRGTVGM